MQNKCFTNSGWFCELFLPFTVFHFAAFHALFDNYNRVEGQAENITQQEIEENNQFLDLVLASHAMKQVLLLNDDFQWFCRVICYIGGNMYLPSFDNSHTLSGLAFMITVGGYSFFRFTLFWWRKGKHTVMKQHSRTNCTNSGLVHMEEDRNHRECSFSIS